VVSVEQLSFLWFLWFLPVELRHLRHLADAETMTPAWPRKISRWNVWLVERSDERSTDDGQFTNQNCFLYVTRLRSFTT